MFGAKKGIIIGMCIYSELRKWLDATSPNNIRRLIIAPDGVWLQYNLGGVMKYDIGVKEYKLRLVGGAKGASHWRPLIYLLTRPRVAVGLEEIVFLRGRDGREVPMCERDLGYLVLGFKDWRGRSESDLIRARFGRLRGIVECEGTLDDLEEWDGKSFIGDYLGGLRRYWNDEWYLGSGIFRRGKKASGVDVFIKQLYRCRARESVVV